MRNPDATMQAGSGTRYGLKIVVRLVLALCLLIRAMPAQADYIPFNGSAVAPNVAEIRVGLEGVSIQLEVFVQDIEKFEALVPDAWFKSAPADRPSEAARLAEFAENGLSVRRADGRALPVSVRLIEPRLRIDRTTALSGRVDPMTGRTFPMPPEDSRVLFVELFYAFGEDRPDTITISPPMTEDDIPLATIGMIVFDREVPVTNFRYLSAPATLSLDWYDPWYSRFENRNLARHHQSGVTTFIYVEPREVRHETLIRLRDLDPWLSLDLASGDMLSADAQNRIKADAAAFLATRNPVRIDGTSAEPDAVRAELLSLDTSGLQVLDGEAPVNADATFLGVILSFPISDLPDVVDVTWDMFNERIADVPATATDMAGPFLSGATPENPLIVWNNHLLTYETPQMQPAKVVGTLSIPLLTVLGLALALGAAVFAWRSTGQRRLAGAAVAGLGLVVAALFYGAAQIAVRNPFEQVPPNEMAERAFSDLLTNISIAQLEPSVQARTNELSAVATAGSLPDVAAELDRALAIRVPGGGVARVNEVREIRLENIQPAAAGYGFQALAEWSALASAGHWGHSHVRDVRYRALVDVVDEDGVWKLDGITVLEADTPDA